MSPHATLVGAPCEPVGESNAFGQCVRQRRGSQANETVLHRPPGDAREEIDMSSGSRKDGRCGMGGSGDAFPLTRSEQETELTPPYLPARKVSSLASLAEARDLKPAASAACRRKHRTTRYSRSKLPSANQAQVLSAAHLTAAEDTHRRGPEV